MTAEFKPEDVKNDDPKSNLTDGKDEVFCRAKQHDTTKDCALTENTQGDASSQKSMDCGSAGGPDESVIAGSRSNAAQTHFSNGQKSKRSSSPGPHPVKTTCVAAHSPNPKLILCHSNSPRKGVSTPSDVEMLSPDSPISKTMLVNSYSDKDHDGSTCTEDFAKAQVMESQPFVRDSDSGCSAKDRVHLVAMGTEDAEIAECSGSSDMSQELIGSQSGAIFERYLSIFSLLCTTLCFMDSESSFLLCRTPLCSQSPSVIVWCTDLFCFLFSSVYNMNRGWLGTPIDELNRMPQCAPPLSHLKVVPNHTVTVRVSQHLFCMWYVVKNTGIKKMHPDVAGLCVMCLHVVF